MTLTETISAIRPLCEKSMRAAETRFQSLAIPLGSLGLLEEVCALLASQGFSISNIDATLIAQRPKVAPYVEQMRRNIASDLSIPLDRVSVKATTEEGLGFTGREEGVAAHAVALVFSSDVL